MSNPTVQENLQQIRHRLSEACRRSGRQAADVELLAVCKGQDAFRIREAYDGGVRLMGENRQQEGEEHMRRLAGLDIGWHFIGRLQKNKINRVLAQYRLLQTVDGVKTAEHIHQRAAGPVDVFVEINIGEEPNKAGFTVSGLHQALGHLAQLGNVRIGGLMTVPPYLDDVAATRPYFRRLRELRDEINAREIPTISIRHLSMGMSRDFDLAVEEGATMVRIGSALFGARGKP